MTVQECEVEISSFYVGGRYLSHVHISADNRKPLTACALFMLMAVLEIVQDSRIVQLGINIPSIQFFIS